jgi:hypothetical protein
MYEKLTAPELSFLLLGITDNDNEYYQNPMHQVFSNQHQIVF